MPQQTTPSTLTTFDQHREHLFNIAYRMVGTVMDAEDVLQEAYLRWQNVSQEQISSPRAYLTTMVSRLCIDHLRSATVRRETYVGPWLPEPLLTQQPVTSGASTGQSVDQQTILAESLSTAFLLLLERLNPVERAIFLLREVFDYDYEEIATIVGKSAANCRQIARRARDRVTAERPRFEPSMAKHRRLVNDFLTASQSGELADLVDLLAEDAVLYSDGGGQVKAARNPIRGAVNISRFIQSIVRRLDDDVQIYHTYANQHPAYVTVHQDRVIGMLILQIQEGVIQTLYVIVNPDKLRHISLDRSHRVVTATVHSALDRQSGAGDNTHNSS